MEAYLLLLRARPDADPAFAPDSPQGGFGVCGRGSRLIED